MGTGKFRSGQGDGIAWLRAHVDHQGDACLPWPLSCDSRVGRGRLGYKGKLYWAHRLMCILAHGDPPTAKHQAAHSCGKGHYACCNPRHLSWKTNSENQLDRRKNGSMLRNSHGLRPSISPEQIAQIHALRSDGVTQVEIGKRLGVSLGCVQYWLKYRATRGNDTGKIRPFTPAEDKTMRAALARGAAISEIAMLLGRTVGSVDARRRRVA